MQVTAFGLNLPLQWATSLCMHAVSSAFMWVLCCRTNKAAGAVPCVVCASGVHQQLPDCCYHLQLGVCSQGGFLGPCCLSCMPGVCQYVCVCSQTCLSPPLCCVSNRLGTVPKWMHCRWRPRFHSTICSWCIVGHHKWSAMHCCAGRIASKKGHGFQQLALCCA